MRVVLNCFLALLLLTSISSADIVSTRILDFRDDAEEELTGPNAGNVFRSSSDLEFGNQNGVEQMVGLRFIDLGIPQGAMINSASILMTATTTDVGTLHIPIFGELAPDTVEFGDLTPLSTRPLTAASVDWDVDPWFPGDAGLNTTTPNLAAIVQEIVNQTDWSSGNSMAFLFLNDPMDTSERIAVSFDADPNQAALLTIDFTPVPEPSTTTLISLAATLSLRRRRVKATPRSHSG